MKLTAKFGEQEMKLQTKFGSSQTKIPSSVGSVTFVGGGGGGGECECVTSWNELEDKPFEYTPPIADIQWDGVIGDKFAIDLTPFGFQNMYFVKVSDEVFTAEELVGATFTTSNGDMVGINENNIDKSTLPGSLVVNGVISVCYSADDFNAAMGAPSGYVTNGTYFLYQAGVYYVSRLVLPAVRIVWDGNIDGRPVIDLGNGCYLCKVSEDVYSKEQIIASTLSISDTFSYVVTEDLLFLEPGLYGTPDACFVYSENDANINMGLPQGTITNGVWFYKAVYSGSEVFYATAFSPNTLKTIDEKFIPDTIARKSDIPESSGGVQSVNGVSPDENGNVKIAVGAKSWNDLEDKPFGVDGTSWALIGSAMAVYPTSSNVDIDNVQFTAVAGNTYKFEVIDIGYGSVVASNIAPCEVAYVRPNMPTYSIGKNTDAVYAVGGGISNKKWLVSLRGIPVKRNLRVDIYEGQEAIKSLDEKFLPENVVLESELNAVLGEVSEALLGLGYQTEEQVKALINDALGVIENGTY